VLQYGSEAEVLEPREVRRLVSEVARGRGRASAASPE
jgi:hypothetical protein